MIFFFIPSGRPAVMQALYFFIKIYPEYFPIVHFRIVHPIKWRGNKKDNFFKFQKFFLKNNNINKNFFFYAENNFYKKSIEKFYKINTVIFNGLNYIKKINKNSHKITVGFLGDSRKFKGFSKIPYLIENLQSKFDNIKFIIQINNPDKNLSSTIKKIFLLKKNFKNIKIYDGPIKNNTFNKILKKINIFPLLHNKNRAKTFGSGFIYTAIGSGICMVIPKGIENWKKVINGKSYLEAKNIDDYLKKISIMIKNYPSYLKAAIEAKNNYYKDLLKNPLITRIIDKNET